MIRYEKSSTAGPTTIGIVERPALTIVWPRSPAEEDGGFVFLSVAI
jgi:hypothetical protein